jgi:hypothetical protein
MAKYFSLTLAPFFAWICFANQTLNGSLLFCANQKMAGVAPRPGDASPKSNSAVEPEAYAQ